MLNKIIVPKEWVLLIVSGPNFTKVLKPLMCGKICGMGKGGKEAAWPLPAQPEVRCKRTGNPNEERAKEPSD